MTTPALLGRSSRIAEATRLAHASGALEVLLVPSAREYAAATGASHTGLGWAASHTTTLDWVAIDENVDPADLTL